MYSVEDLLISHGYKLPKHPASSSTPTPTAVSSTYPAPSSSPPSYSKHHEFLDSIPRHSRTVNGYERNLYGNSDGAGHSQVHIGSCSNNNESRDRGQPRRDGLSKSQVDINSLGESLISDSGFCDGAKGSQLQPKNVSYWRRRGQDFSVLLDYADIRESRSGGPMVYGRSEGPQQTRDQELYMEQSQRLNQGRQRWAAHAQAQAQAQAQVQAHLREREAALHQWRMVTQRKCQSHVANEWHPAANFHRQLSQSESEGWAQEGQRPHVRTLEGMVVYPRTKGKSQSLPRMLQPENLQYVDFASSGQQLHRRVSGHPLSHHDIYRAPNRPENGRPASANQLLTTPKSRFTRPPRPPSYEMHQQIRGSCEVLSGRDSVISHARDRTPLPVARAGGPQLDNFAQDSGPPGYIPPPSYKRIPIMGGVCPGYGEIAVDYRYKGSVCQQLQVAPDGCHWFTRQPAGPWLDPSRERNIAGQEHLYPVYASQEYPGGGVQYIPFDDSRVRHFSSTLSGNSLTDADKIRHIRNELPSVTVSEPVSNDSAFLPPPLGSSIAAKLADGANQTSSSDFDNDNNRWHSDLHKETVDNFPATDQNCNRYSIDHRPSSSNSSAFHAPLKRTSRQGSGSDQVFAETITQVKKITPYSGSESIRNSKRRVSETIFCLVSVPVHTPTNIRKDLSADQNNNQTVPSLTCADTFAVGLKESLNVRSKSVNEIPIKPHYFHIQTSSTSSMRNYKRAPLRKEIIDAWALQAREEKELCYAGSWPGNQYRNQETQTGSPLTVVNSTELESPSKDQDSVQSVLDVTTDDAIKKGTSSHYGYPMAGQKNLLLSSNSAFSRLNLSPTELQLHPSLQHNHSSPTKVRNLKDQLTNSPKKSSSTPTESAEQEVFGQFLLKPVNRRPCDVIGALESINKEMEATITKRSNIGILNRLSKKTEHIKSQECFTACPEPGREAISLPSLHTEKHFNIKVRSKSLASMDVKGVSLRQQVKDKPLTNELSSLQGQCATGSSNLPFVCLQNEPNGLYKQDIPVPQESLLKDVGLTVYTETPGDHGEPTQPSLSAPSPIDFKGLAETVSQLSEAASDEDSGIHHNSERVDQSDTELLKKATSNNACSSEGTIDLKICRSFSEDSKLPQGGLSNDTRLTRDSNVFRKDDYNDRYLMSKSWSYMNESTIADRYLDNLLILEKTNSLPAEDLSKYFEVKNAKGIPENESIEQRAARILGISVPVEALVAVKQHSEDQCDDLDASFIGNLQSESDETQKVDEKNYLQEEEVDTVRNTEPLVIHKKEKRQKHTNSKEEDAKIQSVVVLDLPEFPPNKLPLSLPASADEKRALRVNTIEKRAKGGASKMIKPLQEKLRSSQSADSLARSNSDQMAHLEDVDLVSQRRCHNLQVSESECSKWGEEQSEVQGNITENGVALQGEEGGKFNEERGGEKENLERENVTGRPIPFGDPEEEVSTSYSEANCEKCEREQRGEEGRDVNAEVALFVKNEEIKEVDVRPKTEEAKGEVGLGIVEGQNSVGKAGVKQMTTGVSPAEVTQGAAVGGKLPKPRQRNKLQKPPLLPKPRSVLKRETALPFKTGTCGPAQKEDDKKHSVSDSYDPSRVEKV